MLGRIFSSIGIAALLSFATHARADEDTAGPTQDLTPVSLGFQKLTGEFGGEYLRISVGVKNVGSLAVHGSRGGVSVGTLNNPQTPLYGPNGVGGYNLGAAIPPGALGVFIMEVPVGSLRHCQQVTVRIDTAHSLQSGTSLVFYNDSKSLLAIDKNSIRACVGPIRR